MFFFTKRPDQGRVFMPSARSDPSLPPNTNSRNTSNSDPGVPIEHHLELIPRQDNPPTTEVSTCGYLNGNGSLPLVAKSGFDCRVDTQNAIWGECPTTAIAPSDCGFAGCCVDKHDCGSGCGITNNPNATTYTCTGPEADYCSLALSINGPDQTYSYLGCASAGTTETYFNSPTATSLPPSKSSISALSGAKPSIALASSTSSATSSSPLSSTLAFSPSLSTPTPTPSNNTGAIVGGVLGGLALLSFLLVAVLFYRWHKTRHAKQAQDYDPVWQHSEVQEGVVKEAPKEWLVQAELPSDGPASELSDGKQGETAELPSDIRGSRHTLED